MTPDEYCQDKTAKSGSSFYYSFLFLPPVQRKAIMALYAFCREVDDIVDECSDTGIARVKLQWWRDSMQQTFEGAPQHPVQIALASSFESFNLPLKHFLEIIDGMEMDLNQTRYQTFEDLGLYCYRAASAVGLLAAEIFGYEDSRTLKYAHDLGMAFQLTNILRDVREDASLGRIYIPQDELDRFGVTESDILNSRETDGVKALLQYQASRAREYYVKAFEQLPEQDRFAQRSGLIMASIYQQTLQAIEDSDYRIFESRISLSGMRKIWLAWMTARAEKKRYKKFLRTCHA